MKIALTGASGFFGKRLVPILIAAGHDVRSPARTSQSPVRLEEPESYRPHFAGADVVIHLAAENPRAWSIRSRMKGRMGLVNVTASKALARIAIEEGVSQFIFASSARVYGIGRSPYRENAPLNAPDAYGISKINAEAAILQAASGTGMIVSIMRLPVAREKKGGLISLAQRLISFGVPLPDRLVRAQKSVITVGHLAECLGRLLRAPRQGAGIFNIADHIAVSFGDLCGATSPATVHLPDWMYGIVSGLPFVGYAFRHAIADCELDCSHFENAVAIQ